MIRLRPAQERGHAQHGWLSSYHTFSFADYYDPQEMGYSCLRVINDDTVAPAKGFGTHAHDNMEIISVVLAGVVAHQDSMGNAVSIKPGEIQRMSAGTGIRHSEFNPSATDPVHFLQIWIEPAVQDIAPSYEQKSFSADALRGHLRLVLSPDGREGSVSVNQDASMYRGVLQDGEQVSYRPAAGRRLFVHVARGQVRLNEHSLSAGSGARIEGEQEIKIEGVNEADVLLFDLP